MWGVCMSFQKVIRWLVSFIPSLILFYACSKLHLVRSHTCGAGNWYSAEYMTLCVCVCVCVLVTHLRPALCSPMDCSSPGSSIHGITQARILEWVATPFSRGSSQPRGQTQVFALGANSLPSEPPGKPTWHSLFLNLKAKSISLICFNRDSLTLIFK